MLLACQVSNNAAVVIMHSNPAISCRTIAW